VEILDKNMTMQIFLGLLSITLIVLHEDGIVKGVSVEIEAWRRMDSAWLSSQL
jgi:hypothetical protein